jgi:hypothetical protein
MDQKNLTDVEGAYKWVRSLDWSSICQKWNAIVEEAAAEAAKVNAEAQAKRGDGGSQFMNRAQRRKLEKKAKK